MYYNLLIMTELSAKYNIYYIYINIICYNIWSWIYLVWSSIGSLIHIIKFSEDIMVFVISIFGLYFSCNFSLPIYPLILVMFFFLSVSSYLVISSTVSKILLMYFGPLNSIFPNHLYSWVLCSAAKLELLFSGPAVQLRPKDFPSLL